MLAQKMVQNPEYRVPGAWLDQIIRCEHGERVRPVLFAGGQENERRFIVLLTDLSRRFDAAQPIHINIQENHGKRIGMEGGQ